MMLPSTRHSPQSRWQPVLTAAVVCLAFSVLVAVAQVILNRGFGAGDLLPLFLWSLPFAVIIALGKKKLMDSLRQLSLPLRYVLSVTVGIAGGVLWTYVVAFFLGAWFGAFSFPVLSCWIAGGASGMSVGNIYQGGKQSIIGELAIAAVLCLGAVAVPKYLFDLSAKNQRLQVTAVKWQPGPEPLTAQQVFDFKLSNEDVARLESLGLTGHVTFAAGSGFVGRGKSARVLIVMQRQLKESVELPQPDGVEVIYIQGEDGWKMYPSDAPTLQRAIRLWADEQDPTWATRYSIERADGSRQGGTLFTWSSSSFTNSPPHDKDSSASRQR